MKRRTCVLVLLLALAPLAYTTISTEAANDLATVTGAARAVYAPGATLNLVSVQSLDLGTGVFIEPDGAASGAFNAVLSARSALGQTREITIEGTPDRGTVEPGGRANFSGLATINFGDGMPAVSGVPFNVSATSDSVMLTINSMALPVARVGSGAVSIN
jgi:hypothetical protein